MKYYLLKAENLTDWKSFHSEFKNTLGFPDYYGNIMDAWIDCLDELSKEVPTVIQIDNGKLLKKAAPNVLEALLECAAFVNFRKIEAGEKPTLLVSIFI